MTRPFISLDWGTTSFRAYEVDAVGKVINQQAAPEGILAVKDGAFERVLEDHIGTWSKALPIIASGMITSRQGWMECAYAQCPAGVEALAKSITRKTTASGRALHFITGLHYQSPTIGHDVIRGEETQVLGALGLGSGHVITRGTHCKWIDVAAGNVTGFSTYMTGESFALYKQHSILGRLMHEAPQDDAAFRRGVEKALADPAGMLHSMFSVRTLGLFNQVPADGLSSYLLGLLTGCEVAHATAARDRSAEYILIGSAAQIGSFNLAFEVAGLKAIVADPLCTITGQSRIAQHAGII